MTGHEVFLIRPDSSTATSMPMFSGSNVEMVTSVQRRRRWTLGERIGWVRRAVEPGMTVSLAARGAGVAASQVFQWKPLYPEGALSVVG